MRARIFIDFWNFALQWRDRAHGDNCDWTKVATVLCGAAGQQLAAAQLGTLQLEECRVYASYEPGREQKLKVWLNTFLDRQPGLRVFTTERHWKQRAIHCRQCDTSHDACPKCSAPLGRASEKAVDAQIVTDLISLAWEGAYDVALLVSSDRDFIPAVECLQRRNFKVINATWRGHGHELAHVCWASFEIDGLMASLLRK